MARSRTLPRQRLPLTFEDRAFIAELERVLTPPPPPPPREVVERVQKRVLTIHASNPAPGAEFVYEVPRATALWPLSVMATLTASGAGSDRGVWLEYRDSTDARYCVAGAPVAVAPGTTQSFCWQPAAGTPSWPVDDVAVAPLPVQPLEGSYGLAVVIGGAEAGDQISDVRIRCEVEYGDDGEA